MLFLLLALFRPTLFVSWCLAQLPPEATELDLLNQVLQAITAKNWWLVAGLAVWLLIAVLKKWGSAIPFAGSFISTLLAKKWAPPVLAVLLSVAGGLVNLVSAGEKPSLSWLIAILGSAATAVFTQEVKNAAVKMGASKAAEVKSAEDADKVLKG